ncbi:MAG: hypothetical protein MR618_03740 [Clostridiales bacterium]|nr:hypothetical protein [Clostridiales bacterium]
MNYKKHGISFLIADFLRSSKTQIFFSCLLYVFGLILAVVFYKSPEADKVVDTGRIIGKMILIILPCYVVAMFSTFFKYVVLLFFAGFLYLGFMSGRIVKDLYAVVAFSGIVQFVVVYIPMFLVTILLLNVLINQLSPYVSFSANCVKSTNSKENILTIIKCVLIVFTINIVIFTLWFLIFAKIFRLVAF